MLGCLSACSDFQPFADPDPAGFTEGEAVTFTTNVPGAKNFDTKRTYVRCRSTPTCWKAIPP